MRSGRRNVLGGAAAGLLVDLAMGEPPASVPHPVAALGDVLTRLEARTYADDRAAGVRHAGAGIALGAVAGLLARSTTAVTAACVAGRMLGDVALDVGRRLEAGDLDGARAALPSLVGRDPGSLDEAGMARAVVESVAENTVDAVVAPALWAATLGPAGAGAHKAISTLDSMVGYRNARYERFGWAAARLDDAAAFVPARVTAALVAAARPRTAGAVWRALRLDAPAHPSPNAGVAEAAFAAALDIQLGGPTDYGGRIEARPTLGDGRSPEPRDIAAAVRLSRHCTLILAGALAAGALMPGRRVPGRDRT